MMGSSLTHQLVLQVSLIKTRQYHTQNLTRRWRLRLLGEADTADFAGKASRTCSAEDTNLFSKMSDRLDEHYQKGHIIEKIDQLSAKLASAIPEQESAETPATTVGCADAAGTADQSVTLTAEPTADVTAECSVTITLNSDIGLDQWQSNAGLRYVVAIAPVRSNPSAQQPNKPYTARQQRKRDHTGFLKRRGEEKRKAQKAAKLAVQEPN